MENMTFEQASAELEKITLELESGNTALHESLRLFERGVELTKLCSRMLDEAQQKIGLLTKSADGKMSAKTFTPEE